MAARPLPLVFAALALAACAQPAEQAAAPAPVAAEIRLFAFQPDSLEVPAGAQVTWTNHDDIAHSVTSGQPPDGDGVFDSDFFAQGETFTYTFSDPGDYAIFCRRHNGMTAVVHVKARIESGVE
jgi:plastocyanin